ncbi:hypothetical protein EXE59_09795 [Nocardioides eburneiflavus]|uniref:Uncharacterized protein n=1 Tax=Nocardioides eburneiflavus TaxID=2518372 RepID=A0A4Z1BSD4_9ACTN|nr:hypothetical protein [Nocardioides eburneiflavus]TGN64211.1 hypothetical protein EXE59_09795 [Nocardioides eburneiflavus]
MTSVYAVADVNWLLSALTQASAAMIAIVGGLLVTRYVALHAEQASAQRRVDDLKRRFETAKSQHAAARASFQSGEVNDLLEDHAVFTAAFEATTHGRQLDVETVLDAVEEDGEGLDRELLSRQVAALDQEMSAAVGAIAPLVPVRKRHPDWDEFRRENDVTASKPDLWRWVYDEVCHVAILAAREAEEKARKGALAGMSSYLDPYIRMPGPGIDVETRRANREWRLTAVDRATAAMEQLSQEQRLAQENLDAARQPEGFSLAIRVLIALAVLGMVVPVVVMTFGEMYLHWGWRVVVSTLFLAGVGLLLRFLLVYADFLREGGRTSLPKNLLGLLKP